jgi:hypothetical protein
MRPTLTLTPCTPRETILASCREVLAPNAETNAACTRCERRICVLTRSQARKTGKLPRILTTTPRALPEDDFCSWCARPISEQAVRRAPTDAFVAFARATAPHREVAPAVKPGHDSRNPPLKAEPA